jgi:hypothetical protein
MKDPFNIYKSQVDGKYVPVTQLTPDQRKKLKTRAAPGRKTHTKPLYARKAAGVESRSKFTIPGAPTPDGKMSASEIADASNKDWRKYSRMRKPDLERTHTKVRRNVYVDSTDRQAVKAAQKMPKMRRPTVVSSGRQPSPNMVANAMNTGSKSSPRLITVGDSPLLDLPDKAKKGSKRLERVIAGDAKRMVTHEAVHANSKRNLYRTGKIVANPKKLAMEEGRADAGRLKRTGHMRLPSYGLSGRTGGTPPMGTVNSGKQAAAYRVGRRLAGKPVIGPKHIGIPLAVGAAGVIASDEYKDRKKKR